MKRYPVITGIILFLLMALTVMAQGVTTVYTNPGPPPQSPGAGWSQVRIILQSSGCNSAGYCSSYWLRGNSAAFEYVPARAYRAHGQGSASPPGSGRVADPRATCADGKLAAGTWYLNADWTLHLDVDSCYYTGYLRICSLTYRWSGPRDRRWYFAEDDTCFGGGNGGGGGGGHHDTPTPGPNPTPEPTAPACRAPFTRVIRPRGDWSVEPPYPLVDGQDPDRRGFDLVLDLQGGRAERWTQRAVKVCPSGGTAPDDCPNSWQWQCRWFVTRYNDPIVSVQVSMDLSPSSKAWLQDLGRRYYGLQAREVLPATFDVWTGRAMRVRRAWTYHPLDPGVHEGEIVIRTAGTPISRPQEVRVPYEVRVYLKDTTITDR